MIQNFKLQIRQLITLQVYNYKFEFTFMKQL